MIQLPFSDKYLESLNDEGLQDRIVRRGNEELLEAWLNPAKTGVSYPMTYLMEAFGDDDFKAITTDNVHRSVLKGFNGVAPLWENFAEVTFTDDLVRPQVRIDVGSMGELDKVRPGVRGRITKPGDSKLEYVVEMYEREINLFFEFYNSSNFASFLNVATKLGNAARETIETLVFDEILLGMASGGSTINAASFTFDTAGSARKIYATDNSIGGSKALNATNLNAALKLMQEQTDMDGRRITMVPKYLVCGLANNIEAKQLLKSSVEPGGTNATPNVFAGELTPIISPRITGNEWFVIADPMIHDVIEVTFFNGFREPVITPEPVTTTRELKWSVRLAMGAAPLNPRSFTGANFAVSAP